MNQSENTDQIVRQLANDDHKTFKNLYELYHKYLYAFALNLLPSGADAEEIVQNVFLAVWNQRKNLNIHSSFISYLYGIARHMIYDFIQHKINHEAFVKYYLENNSEYNFITEEEVLFNELKLRFETLIIEIPERRREIFLLSRIEKLSYKEIALKLSISENTVDTQIRHALGFLRSQLLEGNRE